jgi:hypothetical protein
LAYHVTPQRRKPAATFAGDATRAAPRPRRSASILDAAPDRLRLLSSNAWHALRSAITRTPTMPRVRFMERDGEIGGAP